MAQLDGSCDPSDFGVTVSGVYGTSANYFYIPIFLNLMPEQWQDGQTAHTRQNGFAFSIMRDTTAGVDSYVELANISDDHPWVYAEIDSTIVSTTWDSDREVGTIAAKTGNIYSASVSCANEITSDPTRADWPRSLPLYLASAYKLDSTGTMKIWGLFFEEICDLEYDDNADYKDPALSFIADSDSDGDIDLTSPYASMSSLLIRHCLANHLNKILYDSRSSFSIPLFGYEVPS